MTHSLREYRTANSSLLTINPPASFLLEAGYFPCYRNRFLLIFLSTAFRGLDTKPELALVLVELNASKGREFLLMCDSVLEHTPDNR
jgi:hypothetical protein